MADERWWRALASGPEPAGDPTTTSTTAGVTLVEGACPFGVTGEPPLVLTPIPVPSPGATAAGATLGGQTVESRAAPGAGRRAAWSAVIGRLLADQPAVLLEGGRLTLEAGDDAITFERAG
jgi:hypothetical protein